MSGSVSLINGHIDPNTSRMTPQEAINIIEDVTWQDNGRHYGKIAPAREIAISALEKQMPKKLDGKDEDDLVCGCHKCGEINALWKMNGDRNRYCGNCGQALDWGDT